MAKVIETHIDQLIPDDHNFNKHTEYGMHLLEKSVGEFGLGRSILLDKNNRIMGGNGITETAANLDLNKVIVVETDGTQLVAVKRTDMDLDTKRGREMAMADNATGKANLDFDPVQIDMMAEKYDFDPSDWGVDISTPDVDLDEPDDDNVKDDEFDEESENIIVRCKPGDVWQLGDHRLMCGDSISLDDVKRLLGGGKN